METTHPLYHLFHPRHIAMVGATPNKGHEWNNANTYIMASIKQGFQGNIYPVHPTAEKILGFQSYRSIMDIPGEIDLAIFTIPSKVALKVLEECVTKGVKFVHLLTAGFSETCRPEHQTLEKELLQIAKKGGVRIIGPNCMGLFCPKGGLSWTDIFPTTSGPVGLLSQSGQLATDLIRESDRQGLGVSKAVSFGNACDLQAHELIDYFMADDTIEVIGAYLEGLTDGRQFFETAKRVTRHKPLVIWKGGQTNGGSRAILSHTAALAGSQNIWEAMCKQTGIISADNMQEVVFALGALKRGMLPRGKNVAILGAAGGGSVTTTDQAEKAGLKVPRFSDRTIRALEEFVPMEGSSVKNPIDFFFNRTEHFMKLIELLRDDPHIDSLIYSPPAWLFSMLGRSALGKYLQQIVPAQREFKKPIFLVLERLGEAEDDVIIKEVAAWFHHNSIATFPSFDMAAKVINRLHSYNEYLTSDK